MAAAKSEGSWNTSPPSVEWVIPDFLKLVKSPNSRATPIATSSPLRLVCDSNKRNLKYVTSKIYQNAHHSNLMYLEFTQSTPPEADPATANELCSSIKFRFKGDNGSSGEYSKNQMLPAEMMKFTSKDGSLHVVITFPGFSYLQALPQTPIIAKLKLFQMGKLTDFQILDVDGGILRVHKGVLASQSPVLDRMLEADMKEKKESSLKIVDFTAKSVECFVKHLYNEGTTEEFQASPRDLLSLAEKYEVASLKLAAEKYLIGCVDPATVFELLILADLNHAESLKTACSQYIIEFRRELTQSDQWKELMVGKPGLVQDVMALDGWEKA